MSPFAERVRQAITAGLNHHKPNTADHGLYVMSGALVVIAEALAGLEPANMPEHSGSIEVRVVKSE